MKHHTGSVGPIGELGSKATITCSLEIIFIIISLKALECTSVQYQWTSILNRSLKGDIICDKFGSLLGQANSRSESNIEWTVSMIIIIS